MQLWFREWLSCAELFLQSCLILFDHVQSCCKNFQDEEFVMNPGPGKWSEWISRESKGGKLLRWPTSEMRGTPSRETIPLNLLFQKDEIFLPSQLASLLYGHPLGQSKILCNNCHLLISNQLGLSTQPLEN